MAELGEARGDDVGQVVALVLAEVERLLIVAFLEQSLELVDEVRRRELVALQVDEALDDDGRVRKELAMLANLDHLVGASISTKPRGRIEIVAPPETFIQR